jgi:prophage DNA circulation protein
MATDLLFGNANASAQYQIIQSLQALHQDCINIAFSSQYDVTERAQFLERSKRVGNAIDALTDSVISQDTTTIDSLAQTLAQNEATADACMADLENMVEVVKTINSLAVIVDQSLAIAVGAMK